MTSEPEDVDLQRLIDEGEGQHLEFKTRLRNPQAAAKLLAGLANSGGGRLVVGFDESSGALGLSDPRSDEQVIDTAVQLLSPYVSVLTRRAGSTGQPVIVADVEAATETPVMSPDGAYVRRGPTGETVPLVASELARLVTATSDADRFKELLDLLAESNKHLLRLQETLDAERAAAVIERTAAAKEREEAAEGRSLKVRAVDWVISGAIGAILGVLVTLAVK